MLDISSFEKQRGKKRRKEVIFIYSVLAILFTLPLLFNLSTHLGGDGQDGLQYAWNLWWVKESLTSFQNPYVTDMLHHPHGTTLVLHTLNLAMGIVSIPLQWAFGLIATYNLLLIFSFIFSAIAMYVLAYSLTKSHFGSLIAGFIFSFAPYHFGHALGHLDLSYMGLIPLFIYFLFKIRKSYRYAIYAMIALIVTGLTTWYYWLFCFLFGAGFFLYEIKKVSTKRQFIIKNAIVFGGAVLVLLPLFLAMLSQLSAHDYVKAHEPDDFSADLLSFIIPGQTQTIGSIFSGITASFKGNAAEQANYLGYAVLFFAFFGLTLWKNRVIRLFSYACAFFGVLSLGSALHIGGVRIVILPYYFLHEYIPVFNFSAVPSRFVVMIVLSLAVLAAFGVRVLMRQKKRTLIAVAAVVLVVEFISLPFMIRPASVSPFYEDIATQSGNFAVLDVSGTDRSRMFMQTVHQKPIVDGFTARQTIESKELLLLTPGIGTMWNNAFAYVTVRVKNRGDQTWNSPTFGPVHLSYHLYEKDGTLLLWDGPRTEIGVLGPGESRDIVLPVIANSKDVSDALDNEIRIHVDLVLEDVSWFKPLGYGEAIVSYENAAITRINDSVALEIVDFWEGDVVQELRKHNFRYVIFDRNAPRIAEHVGLMQSYQDGLIRVYAVPE